MAFADLRNDFVFRRIFAGHPDILRGLLNDLLERQGEQTIDHIEYLPSEQLPIVQGAKLSILDVRCTDRTGTTFVVEMQLIHHPGFVNRVVYNACKAYVGQLKAGKWYDALTDVVAISICDFELWPDTEQDRAKLPRVPMLSRWKMTERASGHEALLQVQYAFLELPKLPEHEPDTGAERWAWLFVHAPELSDVRTRSADRIVTPAASSATLHAHAIPTACLSTPTPPLRGGVGPTRIRSPAGQPLPRGLRHLARRPSRPTPLVAVAPRRHGEPPRQGRRHAPRPCRRRAQSAAGRCFSLGVAGTGDTGLGALHGQR